MRISPGVRILPDSTSSKRAACRTIGCELGAGACATSGVLKQRAKAIKKNIRGIFMMGAILARNPKMLGMWRAKMAIGFYLAVTSVKYEQPHANLTCK